MHRLIAVVAVVAATLAAAPSVRADDIARMEVVFEVDNVGSRSALSCSSNGLRYRIRGEVVGPASLLHGGPVPVATLYLHEFSFGSFFWRFGDVPGYDHAAALARAGHVSVVVDRLGYDASDHPPGTATCLGAHADVVAQIVRQLREGELGVERLVLAGHSVGGGIAELAAHSFPDLNLAGLILFGWADGSYSSRTTEQFARQAADCLPGGEPAEPGGPSGYAYFGKTDAEFQGNVFADTDPAVVERATARRNRDPCGDNAGLVPLAVANQRNVKSITAPVLLVFGDRDAVFQPDAMGKQAALFTGSSRVTTKSIPGAGHALTLERSAPLVRSTTAAWLTASGLAVAPRPPSDPAVASTGPPPDDQVPPPSVATAAAPSRDGATLPVTGGTTPVALLLGALLVLRYVLSSARRSTSSTSGTMSAGGLLPRKARSSGMAAAESSLSSKRIMPLKKRASG